MSSKKKPMQDRLKISANRMTEWVQAKALPVWAERAQFDDGSWVEHLKLDGQPDLGAERRWRVLARQIYVYAKASDLGWFDGKDIAIKTYEKMREVGYVHRVGMDGQLNNAMRDFYDHAFYILAASSLYAMTGEQNYLDEAESLLDWVDGTLSHPKTGWKESDQAGLKDQRRQNPHMHLLEASLFLHGITGSDKHLTYARKVYSLFKKYFFDAGVVSEFFDPDWTLTKGAYGQTVEPGHGVEWVWLLGQYEKATGSDVRSYQSALYARAQLGRDLFLNDEEDKSGETRRETKRLWVQTEVIKAHLAMAERKTPGSRDMAAATIDALFPTYLTEDGLWNDQINACGANIAKTIPVSTFYHILCMASEAERIAKL